jgi:hypothetical protein
VVVAVVVVVGSWAYMILALKHKTSDFGLDHSRLPVLPGSWQATYKHPKNAMFDVGQLDMGIGKASSIQMPIIHIIINPRTTQIHA